MYCYLSRVSRHVFRECTLRFALGIVCKGRYLSCAAVVRRAMPRLFGPEPGLRVESAMTGVLTADETRPRDLGEGTCRYRHGSGKDPKEYSRPARCGGDDKDGGAEWWDESITSKLHVVHMYLDCLSACVSESRAHET